MKKKRRKYKDGQLLYRASLQSMYIIKEAKFIDAIATGEIRNEYLYRCKPIYNDKRPETYYYEHKIDKEMTVLDNNCNLAVALFGEKNNKDE